jgi:hypothetical protein
MNEFLQLFRCIEARLVVQEALEATELGLLRRAASYWSLAYELEKRFREEEKS